MALSVSDGSGRSLACGGVTSIFLSSQVFLALCLCFKSSSPFFYKDIIIGFMATLDILTLIKLELYFQIKSPGVRTWTYLVRGLSSIHYPWSRALVEFWVVSFVALKTLERRVTVVVKEEARGQGSRQWKNDKQHTQEILVSGVPRSYSAPFLTPFLSTASHIFIFPYGKKKKRMNHFCPETSSGAG